MLLDLLALSVPLVMLGLLALLEQLESQDQSEPQDLSVLQDQ